jgi:predicted Zn finger-like uncharacterized protein
MDVTCERCSTAYEFDDALVSERGTTVKCTSCGHQFKVRRPQPAGAPERWLVRTIDGRELEFRALRELQAAIAQAIITRDDVLSRGGSRPRRLGSIAELEPFFTAAGASAAHSTSLGLGPKPPPLANPPAPGPPRPRPPQASRPEVSVAIPLPRGPLDSVEGIGSPFAPASHARRPSVPPAPPPPAGVAAPLPGVVVAPTGAPPVPGANNAFFDEDTTSVRPDARGRSDDVSAPTVPFEVGKALEPVKVRAIREDWAAEAPPPRSAPEPPRPPRPRPPPVDEPSTPQLAREQGGSAGSAPRAEAQPAAVDADEPLVQDQHTASVPPLTPTPGIVRQSYVDDLADPRFSQASPRRGGGAARWVVGVVVVGMLALAGATVGRKLLVTAAPAASSAPDARTIALLTEGEKSLADGDLESAKEQFDKASILSEREPRAAADLARLAATKGDVDWLRQRLLGPDDPEQATAQRELLEAANRTRKAAERAAEIAPADATVLRCRIDALRLAGDLAGARRLVTGIASASAQPDNALALAELDLSESKPDWPTVLGRLRAALSTDNNLGRARSMLVYALARSGDVTGAKAELERLGALPRPHPLLGMLRAYVSRSSANVDPSTLPDASAKPSAGKPAPPAPAAAAAPAPAAAREPRERPAHVEPHERPTPDEHVPSTVDTSDLPGVKAPPAPQPTAAPAPAPAPAPATPPGVDTSDLPGFK